MKKAAVLISVLLAVCSLSACESINNTTDTFVVSSSSIVSTSSDTTIDSASDTETKSDSNTSSNNNSSKKEESKKDQSKKESSKKEESKKENSNTDERGDVIPSRSDEYEATPNTESKKPAKKNTDTDTATDTSTDAITDTDTPSDENTDDSTDTEKKPDPPYLSGLWIVEKIIDADGKAVDGRDIYGTAFNYAGVLDLNEESEFKLTIGIIPEGQINEGLYEQRDNTLVLQYNDDNLTQVFLDVTKVDGIEMLAFPVTVGGNNYTIYFSR